MANIIAVIWDFDKTLIKGYMQEPLFKKFKVNPDEFWKEVRALPEKYMREQKVRVNEETIYLNHCLKYVRDGKFKGLSNEVLRSFGAKLEFYPGVPEIFSCLNEIIEADPSYKEYDIKLEHYIVSTGMTEVIKGSKIYEYVEGVWGCEFIEDKGKDGERVISEIGYTIDNTTKTRAIFEINKGVHKNENSDVKIDVNTKIPEELRRVHFKNMIYVADGPSDVPAFSLVNGAGGSTFAVYPKDDVESFRQVEKLRRDGRINMYAEADYRRAKKTKEDDDVLFKGSTAYMWLANKIKETADRIKSEEKSRLSASISPSPKHL